MNKKRIITGIVAVALLITPFAFTSAGSALYERIAQIAGNALANRLVEQVDTELGTITSTDEDVTLGAVSGPDTTFETECHLGICYGYAKAALRASSSVPVYLPNPLSATSTILSVDCEIVDNVYGETISVSLATSTDITGGYSTSSPALVIDRLLLAQSGDKISFRPTVHATGTQGELFENTNNMANQGWNPFFLKATEGVALKVASSTYTTNALTAAPLVGSCSAVFQAIN